MVTRRVYAQPHRVRPEAGKMSASEADYATMYLEPLKRTGRVLEYRYAPLNLRLGDHTFYKADFLVVAETENGPPVIQLHELKAGPWSEEAWCKFKVAVEQWPWLQFVVATGRKSRLGYVWTHEYF